MGLTTAEWEAREAHLLALVEERLTPEERASVEAFRRELPESPIRVNAQDLPSGQGQEKVLERDPSHVWHFSNNDGPRCVYCTCRHDAMYLSTKPCKPVPGGLQAQADDRGREVAIGHERTEQKQYPSVGRIVHYFGKLQRASLSLPEEPDDGPFAALVIDVTARDVVTLEVTGRTGQKYIRAGVPFDEQMELGTWCWPVRT